MSSACRQQAGPGPAHAHYSPIQTLPSMTSTPNKPAFQAYVQSQRHQSSFNSPSSHFHQRQNQHQSVSPRKLTNIDDIKIPHEMMNVRFPKFSPEAENYFKNQLVNVDLETKKYDQFLDQSYVDSFAQVDNGPISLNYKLSYDEFERYGIWPKNDHASHHDAHNRDAEDRPGHQNQNSDDREKEKRQNFTSPKPSYHETDTMVPYGKFLNRRSALRKSMDAVENFDAYEALRKLVFMPTILEKAQAVQGILGDLNRPNICRFISKDACRRFRSSGENTHFYRCFFQKSLFLQILTKIG